MSRLNKFRVKDMELVISEAKREADAETTVGADRSLGAAPSNIAKAEAQTTSTNYFQALAEVSPRAALLEAWIDFERMATTALVTFGRQRPGQGIPISKLLDSLLKLSLLTPSEVEVLTKLRGIRNEIVHSSEGALTAKGAAEYALTVSEIATRIRDRSSMLSPQTGSGSGTGSSGPS